MKGRTGMSKAGWRVEGGATAHPPPSQFKGTHRETHRDRL